MPHDGIPWRRPLQLRHCVVADNRNARNEAAVSKAISKGVGSVVRGKESEAPVCNQRASGIACIQPRGGQANEPISEAGHAYGNDISRGGALAGNSCMSQF